MASMLGFVLAHVTTSRFESESRMELVDVNSIDYVLAKFKWVPYLCVRYHIVLFLITTIGSVSIPLVIIGLCQYVSMEGAIAIVQRISGHINILKFLSYAAWLQVWTDRHELKEFSKICISLFHNQHRNWPILILTSTLLFFSSYLFSRKFSQNWILKPTGKMPKDRPDAGSCNIPFSQCLATLRNDMGKAILWTVICI